MLINIGLILYAGWNLIAGQHMTTKEFVDSNPQCNISIIWHWDAENQEWDAWTEDYIKSMWIPEWINRYFDFMNAWEPYWVYCK